MRIRTPFKQLPVLERFFISGSGIDSKKYTNCHPPARNECDMIEPIKIETAHQIGDDNNEMPCMLLQWHTCIGLEAEQ